MQRVAGHVVGFVGFGYQVGRVGHKQHVVIAGCGVGGHGQAVVARRITAAGQRRARRVQQQHVGGIEHGVSRQVVAHIAAASGAIALVLNVAAGIDNSIRDTHAGRKVDLRSNQVDDGGHYLQQISRHVVALVRFGHLVQVVGHEQHVVAAHRRSGWHG